MLLNIIPLPVKISQMKKLVSFIKNTILVIVAVVGVVAITWRILVPYHYDDMVFDSSVWHQYSGSIDEDNPRGKMFDDLRAKLLESRPTRDEVLKMLGEPEHYNNAHLVSYSLGNWSGLRWELDIMEVRFDEKGRVFKVSRFQT